MTISLTKIEKQTGKAILAWVAPVSEDGEILSICAWFPLSQVKVAERSLDLPEWLANRKLQEEEEKYGYGRWTHWMAPTAA